MYTLDFETEGIEAWPNYPPKPVGLSVRHPDGRTEYLAFGHPTGNNCAEDAVETFLKMIWDEPLLFHSSAFDIEVAMKRYGLPYPKHVHDTIFMIFLYDPHADSVSLKPSAQRILGISPEEQIDLEKYIRSHIRNAKDWGAYIAKAPAHIVGPYAIGDVVRTYALYEFLRPILEKEGMWESYMREIKLQPILLEATRRGIRVDTERLGRDVEKYETALIMCDRWLREHLKAPNLNVDSNAELADALDRAGLASDWPLTPTGKRSTSKDSLKAALKCKDTLDRLAYRNTIATCISTFAKPWLLQSSKTGRCHPSWNQVRGSEYGTRTGRLSSNGPNFQNVPNDFEGLVIPEGFPPIIQLRNYLLPEKGHVWVKRDYSQQELRVLAHFEDGGLYDAYKKSPRMDVHQYAQELILKYTGHEFKRKQTKIVSFTLVYGGGIPALTAKLESTPNEAAFLKETYLSTFPDVRALMNAVKSRGRAKLPVRTTGGRLIYAEKTKDGRDQSYKLLNHLIQGSSADITKQSIINWHEHPDRSPEDLFLATVHDENNTSIPAEEWERGLRVLGEAMFAVPLDIPLLSEGFVGRTWGEVASVEESGEYV
jgi:DNA polymerase I-like protein with 3'-5' exonuclease and polymerase domains